MMGGGLVQDRGLPNGRLEFINKAFGDSLHLPQMYVPNRELPYFPASPVNGL